jgi:ribosomal protein S18 acetylase RimI-like enzyme
MKSSGETVHSEGQARAAAPRLSAVSGEVREFTQEDIAQVADLHRRVFAIADRMTEPLLDSYRLYLDQLFLNDAWRADDAKSLVYEQDGAITGFFGVVARRMSFQGRIIRVKSGTQAVVDPASRGLGGLKLYSAFLDGSYDLYLGDEANAAVLPLWNGFGGVASLLYSMQWMYPLRPAEFARQTLERKRIVPAILGALARPAIRTADALAARVVKRLSVLPHTRVYGEEVTCNTLLECLDREGLPSLRPAYDLASLSRSLQRVENFRRNGRLYKTLVRTEQGEVAGWHLYHLNPKGFSEVVQVYALPGFGPAVLDHLIEHARSRGAAMLRGRMEPSLMTAFGERHCMFHVGPAWALVYSPKPEILRALEQGDAFFSRLEGEWPLHFQPQQPA